MSSVGGKDEESSTSIEASSNAQNLAPTSPKQTQLQPHQSNIPKTPRMIQPN